MVLAPVGALAGCMDIHDNGAPCEFLAIVPLLIVTVTCLSVD